MSDSKNTNWNISTIFAIVSVGITCSLLTVLVLKHTNYLQLAAPENRSSSDDASGDYVDMSRLLVDEKPLSQAEVDAMNEEWIDIVAGHPDDPDLPQKRLGASDEVLAATDPQSIAELIRETRSFAERRIDEPRFLFALGRAALFHGYTTHAKRMLSTAANYGSAPAMAYLADPLLTEDDHHASKLLQRSVTLGFQPAAEWLSEIEEPEAVASGQPTHGFAPSQAPTMSGPFNFSQFNQPGLLKALYTGDLGEIDKEKLKDALYISNLNESAFNDETIMFYSSNPKRLLTEVDPTTGTKIAQKLMSSGDLMNQAASVGMKSAFAPLMAIAQARKSGGSISDELAAASYASANNPMVELEKIKYQANQDGRKLLLAFDDHPETVLKIYAGIRKYANAR